MAGLRASLPQLRGREREAKVLADVVAQISIGRSGIVLVEGEAGLGKTRLLEEAIGWAERAGLDVAQGRSEELERTRPFGVVASALGCSRTSSDPQRAAIGELLNYGGDRGPITVTSDPGLQFRVVDALTDLVEVLALRGPLLVAVDDLQWADPSSLLTLGTICRRLAYLPLGVIGAFRSPPRTEDLGRLVRVVENLGAHRVLLAPLADGDVRCIVADVLGAEPAPRLLASLGAAGGNPLFLTELLGAMVDEGSVEVRGGLAEITGPTLPRTLPRAILRRVSLLPETTVAALRSASILGTAFSLSDLATVTGRSAIEMAAALADALRAHILEDDGHLLRFRHSLIRDAIYEDLPLAVRSGFHREAGHRLAQSHAPVVMVAEHLARGATRGDPDTVMWLSTAARDAATSSPASAAELFARAVQLAEPNDPVRDQLTVERVACLNWAGQLADAEAVCRAALEATVDPPVAGGMLANLGHALLATGRTDEGLRELDRAAAAPGLDALVHSCVLGWSSFARLSTGDLAGAVAAADEVLTRGVCPISATVGLTSRALARQLWGDLASALHDADAAVDLADQSPGRMGHRYPVHGARGLVLMDHDRLEDARSAFEAGMRAAEALGAPLHLSSYQVFLGLERFHSGVWDEAISLVETGLRLGDEGAETYTRALGDSVLSSIALHRGDLRSAVEVAARAKNDVASMGQRYGAPRATLAHALAMDAAGQHRAALASVLECWDECSASGLGLELAGLGPDLVHLLVALGDRERAHEVLRTVQQISARNQVAWLGAAALRCRGLVEEDAAALSAAAEEYVRSGRVLDVALASEEAATLLLRQGNVDRGRPLMAEAIAAYEGLRAERDLNRADAVLREAGVRRGSRGARDRPQIGWQSLTPAEGSVAQLVAEGLTNPQIGDRLYISRRTVQNHLAHVFVKLGLSTRAELAAELARRDERASRVPS